MKDEQRLLKWCGLHRNEPTGGFWWDAEDNLVLDKHKGEELTLDFLFKYAVLKLDYWLMSAEENGRVGVVAQLKGNSSGLVFDKDPAKALMKAIMKVIE